MLGKKITIGVSGFERNCNTFSSRWTQSEKKKGEGQGRAAVAHLKERFQPGGPMGARCRQGNKARLRCKTESVVVKPINRREGGGGEGGDVQARRRRADRMDGVEDEGKVKHASKGEKEMWPE